MTYRCHYFTDRGNLIGRGSVIVAPPAGSTERSMWVSWGNVQGTFWQTGRYYVECDADGVFLAGASFLVERR